MMRMMIIPGVGFSNSNDMSLSLYRLLGWFLSVSAHSYIASSNSILALSFFIRLTDFDKRQIILYIICPKLSAGLNSGS